MSLPPLLFTKHAISHDGYVGLIAELRRNGSIHNDMLVVSELMLHLECRVHELEKEVKRLQDEKNIVGDRPISE